MCDLAILFVGLATVSVDKQIDGYAYISIP